MGDGNESVGDGCVGTGEGDLGVESTGGGTGAGVGSVGGFGAGPLSRDKRLSGPSGFLDICKRNANRFYNFNRIKYQKLKKYE